MPEIVPQMGVELSLPLNPQGSKPKDSYSDTQSLSQETSIGITTCTIRT
jgi:hypothetical protein